MNQRFYLTNKIKLVLHFINIIFQKIKTNATIKINYYKFIKYLRKVIFLRIILQRYFDILLFNVTLGLKMFLLKLKEKLLQKRYKHFKFTKGIIV